LWRPVSRAAVSRSADAAMYADKAHRAGRLS
jgi:hypothetical protein